MAAPQARSAPPGTTPAISAAEAILALAFCPDRQDDKGNLNFAAPVAGRTRLMKELFLLTVETDPGRAGCFKMKFTPAPYGPSSYEVQAALESLTASGDVEQVRALGSPAEEIRLTQSGVSKAFHWWQRLDPDVAQAIWGIKSQFNSVPLTALLYYVYSTYPAFTVNSRIRQEVLGPPA